MDGFELIIKELGGSENGAMSALARKLGISRQAVAQWKANGIPPRRVPAISEATGIPRAKLRPDIYG